MQIINRQRAGIWLVVFMLLAIQGCTNVAPRYAASSENVMELRNLNASIELGLFTGGPDKVNCRSFNPMAPPDGETFAEFIRKAFQEELQMAGAHSPGSPTVLTGKVLNVDLDSGMGTGRWTIAVEIAVSGSAPFVVETGYEFEGGFAAFTVCENARNSMVPAVQEFVRDVIIHESFQNSISGS